jgi:hypothetical protein
MPGIEPLTELIEKIFRFDPAGIGIREQYFHGSNTNIETGIKSRESKGTSPVFTATSESKKENQ